MVSCLTTPPRPRFYNYKLIKKATNNNTFSLENPEFNVIYSGNRYYRSILHLKLLTLNNTELNIKDIGLNSNILKSDSLDINLIPNGKIIKTNTPITINKKDTLNLLIFFINKNRIKAPRKKAYLNLKERDTLSIDLEINNEKHHFFYQSIH